MTALRLRVERIDAIAPDIRGFVLRGADGGALPGFVPGSHIVLECGAAANAYSLTGDGVLPEAYMVSVRLDPGGRGGSQWMHALRPGDALVARGPRDAFPPVATARHHLLVAGGIGVTPILSHLRAARLWGRRATVIYAHSDDGPAPHEADLRAAAPGPVQILRGRDAFTAAMERVLASQPLGTHLYVCGPAGMIEAVLAMAERHGWPAARLHAERFAAADVGPGVPFTVALRRSGRQLEVPAGISLLDALASAGIAWPAMCRRGVCGECRMEGVEGTLLHHDLVLSPDARDTCLMPCVSRADGLLTLDL